MPNIDKKILVVEDTKNYLWLISQKLTLEGFNVITAEDGQEGLDAAKKEKPDLMLLDIEMPKMTGIEMAKKLKEEGIIIPTIFVTNMSDMKHMSQAMENASDYIIKSDMDIDSLVARVKERLRIK